MKLGTLRQRIFSHKTLAALAAGGTLLAVVGCQADAANVVIDSLTNALTSAIPALMDLLKESVTNPGITPGETGGGGGGWLPTVMNETVQTMRMLLA
jgi:hypothetical protein